MVAIERNGRRDTRKIKNNLSCNGKIEIPTGYLRLVEIRDKRPKMIIDYVIAKEGEDWKNRICNEGIASYGQVVYFEGKSTRNAELYKKMDTVVEKGEENIVRLLACGKRYDIPIPDVVPTGMNDSEKVMWLSRRHRLFGDDLYACDIDGWLKSEKTIVFEYKWFSCKDKGITGSEKILANWLKEKGIPMLSVFYHIGTGWYGDTFASDGYVIRCENMLLDVNKHGERDIHLFGSHIEEIVNHGW